MRGYPALSWWAPAPQTPRWGAAAAETPRFVLGPSPQTLQKRIRTTSAIRAGPSLYRTDGKRMHSLCM